ncbi:MAG: hypothetical protein M0C28_22605 [Candidatus Moduliflexus flocculans]|nr:hypothetical protein [Candidatus Moduliflexus flocculans]
MSHLWDILKNVSSPLEMEDLNTDESEEDNENGDEHINEHESSDNTTNSTDEAADEGMDLFNESVNTHFNEDSALNGGIYKALRAKPDVIRKAIIDVLEERPKNSCVKENC